MALAYCEVCGVLLPGEAGGDLPEGVICDACFASRRVVVEPETMPSAGDAVEFSCVYCKSVLRVAAVAKRTKVRCPKCSETFFLQEDGSVEARLQGNTTAILAKPERLDPLTPPQGTPADTGGKTQPMNKLAAPSDVVLEPLGGAEDIDIDLLPPTVGPGEAGGGGLALRASDEGRVDLDPEALKRKTSRLRPDRKGTTRRLRRDLALQKKQQQAAADEPEPEHDPEQIERERRAVAAQRRAAELEAQAARRGLAAGALWALWGAPLIALALLLAMTTRGTGFASRGAVGDALERAGETTAAGARALDEVLGAPLGLGRGE